MKVERVSYEVMTPSAARGVLESVFWKPQVQWNVHAIEVLAPIEWTHFRRNEIQLRASSRGGDLLAEDERTQRNTVALRDVDYVIEASFALTDRTNADDSVAKYAAMFLRRLNKGQRHHASYLGCREFAADVSPADGAPLPIEAGKARRLGLMLYDFDYSRAAFTRPLFFDATLDAGVLRVPDRELVLRDNGHGS